MFNYSFKKNESFDKNEDFDNIMAPPSEPIEYEIEYSMYICIYNCKIPRRIYK